MAVRKLAHCIGRHREGAAEWSAHLLGPLQRPHHVIMLAPVAQLGRHCGTVAATDEHLVAACVQAALADMDKMRLAGRGQSCIKRRTHHVNMLASVTRLGRHRATVAVAEGRLVAAVVVRVAVGRH